MGALSSEGCTHLQGTSAEWPVELDPVKTAVKPGLGGSRDLGTQWIFFLLYPNPGCTGLKRPNIPTMHCHASSFRIFGPVLPALHTYVHSFTHSSSTWAPADTFTHSHSQTVLLILGSIMASAANTRVKMYVSLLKRWTKGHC